MFRAASPRGEAVAVDDAREPVRLAELQAVALDELGAPLLWTWRSLCHEHGLPDADAVALVTAMVTAAR